MSAWRRKALALFPKYKKNIEENYSLYDFWFDFLPLTQEAHLNNDFKFLEKIYGLAEWCINEHSETLRNATGVNFYEHLLDIKRNLWPEIISWISDDVIYQHNIKGLWNCRLGEEENTHLENMLKKRKENNSTLTFSHLNTYTTGEIYKLWA